MDLWVRIFASLDVDAGLVHNHYCLNDTQLLELIPLAEAKKIGIINGSPFGSGLLTDRGPADWHPVSPEERNVFRSAAEFCKKRALPISKVAMQFSSQQILSSRQLYSAPPIPNP